MALAGINAEDIVPIDDEEYGRLKFLSDLVLPPRIYVRSSLLSMCIDEVAKMLFSSRRNKAIQAVESLEIPSELKYKLSLRCSELEFENVGDDFALDFPIEWLDAN